MRYVAEVADQRVRFPKTHAYTKSKVKQSNVKLFIDIIYLFCILFIVNKS